jgi:uncharacterized protein YukE
MPNFEKTKVDPNLLSMKAGIIDESLNSLDNAFRSIENTIQGALLPAWKDIASSQFSKQYDIDKNRFNLTMMYLHKLNQQLKEAAGIFDSADGKSKDLVSRLQIG